MINLKLDNPVTRVGLALLILTVPLSQSRAENLITSQLMPVLETACGVTQNPLVTKFFNISSVCDLRDMVSSLAPILEEGTWENMAKTLGVTMGGKLVEMSGAGGAVDAVNAFFADAKSGLQAATNSFTGKTDGYASQVSSWFKGGNGLNDGAKKTITSLPVLKPAIDAVVQQLGVQAEKNVKSAAANTVRAGQIAAVSQHSDTAAGEQAGRAAQLLLPTGRIDTLSAQVSGSLSTRDGIQTLGQIAVESLRQQVLSSTTLSTQLAAMTQQQAITNELMVAQYNDLIAKNQSDVMDIQSKINDALSNLDTQVSMSGVENSPAAAQLKMLEAW